MVGAATSVVALKAAPGIASAGGLEVVMLSISLPARSLKAPVSMFSTYFVPTVQVDVNHKAEHETVDETIKLASRLSEVEMLVP